MLRALAIIFTALFGLAFGSFLNVCVSRWPEGESIVGPGSHCRSCGRPLLWRENIPLASWLVLGGRCGSCGAWIGWRYPLVEFSVAFTWAVAAWQTLPALFAPGWTAASTFDTFLCGAEKMILCWLLIGLAVLDAEYLWLPDRLTLGGAVLGLPFAFVSFGLRWVWPGAPLHWTGALDSDRAQLYGSALLWVVGIALAPALILFTRWAYRLIRHREGIGLGDAKLMLLLAVWLGLSHTLLAFVFGVALGTVAALVLLVTQRARKDGASWALTKLPLGTFLCVGGIFSALWGSPLIAAYLRAAGF